MVSHVRDENRLHFSYIERISSDDPQEQLRNRTVEYYAEFSSLVFTTGGNLSSDAPNWSSEIADGLIGVYGNRNPDEHEDYEAYRQNVIDDVELVRAVVEAYDPDFNWHEAAIRRASIVARMVRDRQANEYRTILAGIQNPEARALVQEYVDIVADASESAPTRFIRLAGTHHSVVAELRDMDVWNGDMVEEGRGLEIEVGRAQRTAIEVLDSEVRAEDLPAYHALRTLLETLADTDSNIEAMHDFQYWVRAYTEAAGNAGPEHVEAARRYMEILQGLNGLSRELLAQITRYVDIYLSSDHG